MLKVSGSLLRSERACSRPFRKCLQPFEGKNSLFQSTRPVLPRRYLQSLSKRQLALLEDHVHASVASTVKDPVVERDLASLDWLHRKIAVSDDGSTFHLLLRLPTLLHPELTRLKEEIQREAEKAIEEWNIKQNVLQKLPKVNIEAIATTPWPMMAQLVDNTEELFDSLGPGLANVTHFIAVYSCKGGVGKSTVAVNFAYELAAMGGRIGLVDLDIYGPSLPVLVRPTDVAVRSSPAGKGFVYPIQHGNVKLLSLGYVNTASGVPGSGQGNGASIMRGPMAGKVVSQLLKGTDWGELDALILDLPPGTGDVQLQVLQDLQISGSVAVTTPSKLALVDLKKGVEMFTSLGVPTLAVVENMAYFECEGGKVHFPFGRGIADTSLRDHEAFRDVASIIQLPISEHTNAAVDQGEPFCLARTDEYKRELAAFSTLARAMSKELLKMQFSKSDKMMTVVYPETDESFDLATISLSLDKISETFTIRLLSDSGAIQKKVSAVSLRARDPKTGLLMESSPFIELIQSSSENVMVSQSNVKKSPAIIPNSIQRRGRYGYGVQWADGATIIYSMRSLVVASGGTPIYDHTAQ